MNMYYICFTILRWGRKDVSIAQFIIRTLAFTVLSKCRYFARQQKTATVMHIGCTNLYKWLFGHKVHL